MLEDWRITTVIYYTKTIMIFKTATTRDVLVVLYHFRKRMIEKRLGMNISISKNQFNVIVGISTIEAIHLIRKLIKCYRNRKKGFFTWCLSILRRFHDRVLKEML